MKKLDEFEKKVKTMNSMLKHWILVNNKLKEVDLLTWAKWFENFNSPGRITKHTIIKNVRVSTVFLGLDHSFNFSGKPHKPVLWETMMFNTKDDGKSFKDKKGFSKKLVALSDYQVRYSSLKDAQKGHKEAVKFAKYILK